MDPRLVTVMLALVAVGCYVGGAFVPNAQAQTGLFMLGSFLLGAIGVTKPADVPDVRKARALAKVRPGPDLTKVRKL